MQKSYGIMWGGGGRWWGHTTQWQIYMAANRKTLKFSFVNLPIPNLYVDLVQVGFEPGTKWDLNLGQSGIWTWVQVGFEPGTTEVKDEESTLHAIWPLFLLVWGSTLWTHYEVL